MKQNGHITTGRGLSHQIFSPPEAACIIKVSPLRQVSKRTRYRPAGGLAGLDCNDDDDNAELLDGDLTLSTHDNQFQHL